MDWADDFIPKYQIGPKFPRNCGNILVALLRSCDKECLERVEPELFLADFGTWRQLLPIQTF